jgi:hypothetical protein
LYNIEPIGLGTPYVESLTSYISRLADAHCVFTGDIISKIYAPYLSKAYLTKISIRGGGFYETAIGINGVGQLASEFSQLTNELTGRADIRYTTLLNWSVIFPFRGLLKKTKSWCPLCYEEAKLSDSIIYDQLIWNFQLVDYCMKHLTPLENTCLFCKSTMPVIDRKSLLGFCSNCCTWLGNTSSIAINDQYPNNSLKDISLIGELLSNNQIKLSHALFQDSLNFYIDEYFHKSPFKAAGFFKIPKSTFATWIAGRAQPNINYLIKICKMLGLSIIEFLQKQEPIKDNSPNEFYVKDHFRYDHQEINRTLKNVILSNKPTSISEVARIIGCDRKLLSTMYRKECNQIKNIYNAHLLQRKNERLSIKTNQLKEAFHSLVKQGHYPSRRKLEEILGSGFLKEKAIQEYWNQLKKEQFI